MRTSGRKGCFGASLYDRGQIEKINVRLIVIGAKHLMLVPPKLSSKVSMNTELTVEIGGKSNPIGML